MSALVDQGGDAVARVRAYSGWLNNSTRPKGMKRVATTARTNFLSNC
jgi:hypothetical protein